MTALKQVELHESRLPDFETVIQKLNRKAKKWNIPQVEYSVVNEDKRLVNYIIDGQETKIRDTFYTLELSSDVKIPKVGGWIFLASLDHYYGQAIVSRPEFSSYKEIEIPTEYLTSTYCEHCNSQRKRKTTYVLYNESTKEFKNVGSTCIADYIRNADFENFIKWFEQFNTVVNVEYPDPESDEFKERFERQEVEIDLKIFLAYSSAAISEYGFVSTAIARDQLKVSTADQAIYLLLTKNEYLSTEDIQLRPEHDDNHHQLAEEVINYWSNNETINNDYARNCKVLADTGFIKYKHIGLAASMVYSYLKHADKLKQDKINPENSEHVGKVKDRIEKTVTILFKKVIESYYGISTIIKMIDDNENLYVWFATGNLDDVEIGSTHEVKMTIKSHDYDQYQNNAKITKVNRVKGIDF